MPDMSKTGTASKLNEYALRDELREMRAKIPDRPAMNPIVNLAFDLSRRLESGEFSFEDIKALAGRLMDRAFIRRAKSLRERVGYADQADTLRDFSAFVEETMGKDTAEVSFEEFANRWSRARSGVVLTAHPTFGLSEAMTRRMVEFAVDGHDPEDGRIGLPHRPDTGITLDYEHASAQTAIGNLRTAYADLLNSFYSVASQRYGDKAYALRPKLATFASWVGYDLDGRTDIQWSYSFLLKLQEKRASLADVRERFLTIKHRFGDKELITRVSRQITGKLDLAIAAVDEQVRALTNVEPGMRGLAKTANVITRSDSYNLTSTEPLVSLFTQMIEAVDLPQWKRSLASLSGLVELTGLGTAHIHVRINSVQLNNAFRAFVHEP